MLNKDLKLNKKIFSPDIDMEPTRAGYGRGLLQAGKDNNKVVALCADLTESTKTDLFAKEFPDRFVEMGVGEQSMASVASGMAAMGKIPFFASYAMFSPGRNWEQIRTTICYNDMNAKIIGAHSGVSVGPDGGTHQALEDIAITRVIPRMTVISPCDSIEAEKAVIAAAKYIGPVYIRLTREKTPVFTTDSTPFEIGKVNLVWKGENPKFTIFSTGPVLYNCLLAAKELYGDNVDVHVVNVSTIKPLDIASVVKYAEESGNVVTVEEHQVAGGLGSTIAEVLSERLPMPITRIGINDEFGQSGEPEELIEHYGLDCRSILRVINNIV